MYSQKNIINYFLILLFIAFVCPLFCQEIKFYTPAGDLSQNTITDIIQDQNGFLWVGTQYGLNRYNGLEYEVFLPNETQENGISGSSITTLANDTDGNIWIGTYGMGISVVNPNSTSFIEPFSGFNNQINAPFVTDIYFDSNGKVWVGTQKNGLKLVDKQTQKVHHFFAAEGQKNRLSVNYVTCITEDINHNILIGTWGGGLSIYNVKKDLFQTINHSTHPLLPNNNIIRCLSKGKNNTIWLGTQQGLFKWQNKSGTNGTLQPLKCIDNKVADILSSAIVLSILEDSQGRLWIGTENKGLFEYDQQSQRMLHYEYDVNYKYSLSSNSIWSLFEDHQGSIWIGTFKKGLLKIDPNEEKFAHISAKFESKHTLSYGLVSAFVEDSDKNIWVGTDGGGLNIIYKSEHFNINEIKLNPFPGLQSQIITSLLYDSKEKLWVGTWEKGLYYKDKNSAIFKPISSLNASGQLPVGTEVLSISEGIENRIWIASYREGLSLYDYSENRFYNYVSGIENNSISSSKIRSIVEDKDGFLWLGTGLDGLDRIKINAQKEIIEVVNYNRESTGKRYINNNTIICLYIDINEDLWVGTEGGGLNKYNKETKHFDNLSTKDGLPSNIIFSIIDDGKRLWVSTNNGLASTPMDSISFTNYEVSDGLQAKEFNKLASYKTSDNYILFGGVNGFNYFKPSEITQNSFAPQIHITKVIVNNIPIPITLGQQKIKLKAKQNDLHIEFAVLNYSQSAKNQYRYLLDGYDKNWNTLTHENHVEYTNLPPGKYTFKVKASHNDQIWPETSNEIQIQIVKPWFLTIPMLILYTLLLFITLSTISIFIQNRIKLKNQLEVEQFKLSKMKELNELKSRFFANISHEFKTPLTLIISPLKAIQRRLEKVENKNQVSIMLNNAERLLMLINQILSLSKLESGTEKLRVSKNNVVEFIKNITSNFINYADEQFITFDINLPPNTIEVYFEKDKLEKVLINLISNAFKFTPEFGRITLQLEEEENQICISISDTGIGISADQLHLIFNRYYRAQDNDKNIGTGIGLSLSKQLVEIHKGHIDVRSVEGQGTTFDVYLPLGKDHLDKAQIYEPEIHLELSEDSRLELKDFQKGPLVEEGFLHPEEDGLPVVLIAEDNPDLLSFTKTYLQMNYRIIEAANGIQAFQLAKRNIPDIIITDWMMPKMTGYELIKRLRENELTSHIFIILLTVKSSEESKIEGLGVGADYYITKPFNPKILDLRIQNILQKRNTFRKQIIKTMSSNEEAFSDLKISPRDQEFLDKVISIIDKNISNSKFQIDDICKVIGYSKSQLYRKMKGLVGQSTNEFIRSIRLKRAALLLSNEDFTIAEVTYKVGFNDLQYFRKCFKAQYNTTPSEYAQLKKV